MTKKPKLKTKRLILTPMEVEALDKKVLLTEDEGLRMAYGEMLEGCRRNPEQWLFYTPWEITLRSTGEAIGDAGFKGGPKRGAVELGYGLDAPYWGSGFMTEAAEALVEWAFAQKDVYIVEAETEPENRASQRVLEKLGFHPAGTGEEGPRFSKEAEQPKYMAVYMLLGMSIGTSVGTAMGNLSVGMCLGLAAGLAFGSSIDAAERKKRRQITERGEEETV